MATLGLEDRESIDEIKAWWQIYGNLITNVLLAVAIIASLWTAYNWYNNKQIAVASQTYFTLLRHVASKDLAKSKALSTELIEKYPSSSYAKFAAMLVAKLQFNNNDAKSAKEQLNWVIKNGSSELRDIARLNLVAILIDEKAYDEANKQLNEKHEDAAKARFANLLGDIALMQNKPDDAKKHFSTALKAIELNEDKDLKLTKDSSDKREEEKIARDNSLLKILLKQKLDALGGN